MNIRSFRALCAAAVLAAGSVGSHAAIVNFDAWAYGNGNAVKLSALVGGATQVVNTRAGAFGGRLTFEPGDGSDAYGFSGAIDDFVTYCVEISESFRGIPSADMGGYRLVAGADYLHWGADLAGRTATAERIGKLMSWLQGTPGWFDADGPSRRDDRSSAVQLAVWNILYDPDATVGAGPLRVTAGSSALINGLADGLLSLDFAGLPNALDVFVVTKAGSQDFLVTRARPATLEVLDVPEPGTLGLVAAGLIGFAASRRRRGR